MFRTVYIVPFSDFEKLSKKANKKSKPAQGYGNGDQPNVNGYGDSEILVKDPDLAQIGQQIDNSASLGPPKTPEVSPEVQTDSKKKVKKQKRHSHKFYFIGHHFDHASK